ncbi:MAG: response regulator [Hyphomicrobiaceae bacterium]|nr:MAG: response regulator [Hyphomicrobiaceae bacterium]
MREPPLILVVDDNEANVDILETRLTTQGYAVITARDGEEAIERAKKDLPDLILLDIMMPKIDGLNVTRQLKADASLPYMPIILVTAKADTKDVVVGLDAGADEYLTKPIDQASLVARVRSILRAKKLHDLVEEQARRLADHAAELDMKVKTQVAEIERMGALSSFLPRQLAELVVNGGVDKLLDSHRQEISVLFADLRGFTAFSEVAEPEDVMGVLRDYHAATGDLIDRHEGTLQRFLGDGLMVLFNDPLPCPDPAHRAVRLAADLRDAVKALGENWNRKGHRLGFGVGLSFGYATLGRIGFKGRLDYTAIGTVVNQAARLCAEARDGDILLTQRLVDAAGGIIETEPLGELVLKGLRQPLVSHRLKDVRRI